MFYTNIFCGKNWRHEDYEFYSIWPVWCRMDPSVPCCVVSCYTQCPGRCEPSKQETVVSLLGQDCSIIANMHILIIFRGVWAFYTVFWHIFCSGMHPICCSGIRHLAETPLLISININYELKLPYAKSHFLY